MYISIRAQIVQFVLFKSQHTFYNRVLHIERLMLLCLAVISVISNTKHSSTGNQRDIQSMSSIYEMCIP